MDRRRFLNLAAGTTAAGAVTVLWPDWLARAFAADDDEGNAAPDTFGDVGAAYRRAKALGKPLLVFVVPAKTDERFVQGQVFGALLNHGSKEALADLALCEVVCAKVATVRDTLEIEKDFDEPLMILVETARGGVTAIAPKLTEVKTSRMGDGERGEAVERERLRQVEKALRDALVPNGKALDTRARDNRISLGEKETAALVATLGAGRTPKDEALRRGAAIVRFTAESSDDHRTAWVAALAAMTEKHLKKGIPEGARWANYCGCGVEIEGEKDSPGVACGMGYTPALSQRFLYFYTR